ncbi:MAG: radical SAM protein [Candidatus Methanoperedens sp.]
MKKGILLVNPPNTAVYVGKQTTHVLPPLGLVYIASVLEQNEIPVEILDMNALHISPDEFKQIVKEKKTEFIGFGSTTSNINIVKELAFDVKMLSSAIVIVGGPHPSILSEDTLSDPNIDIVVRGEGEQTMLEIMSTSDLSKIKGIYYKDSNKEIKKNEDRPLIENIDSIPFPARHLLPIDKYWSPGVKRKPFATILTSRGCPYHCIFCQHGIFGYTWRFRSPENIVAEIDHLVQTYKVKELDFLDDCFTLDADRVSKVCDYLIERNYDLIWRCSNGIRVDRVTKPLLVKMHDAGCVSVAFGVESGDEQILKQIKKGTTLDRIEKAVQWSKEIGIETTAFFIIGNIGENEISIQKTIDFAKKLDVDYCHFGILVPFPGTEAREYIEKHGKILIDDFSRYTQFSDPIFECEKCTPDFLVNMQKKAYHDLCIQPKYIVKRFMKIKSLDEFLNLMKGGISLFKYINK